MSVFMELCPKPQLKSLAATAAIFGILLLSGAWAQETETSVNEANEARILGPIPDGSPSEPAPPPPRLEVSNSDIVASQTKKLSQREITFQKLKPLILPKPLLVPEVETLPQEQESGFQQEQKPYKTLMLGASVYMPDGNPENARTFVQIWDPQRATPASLWVNANFLWLTGFAEFETQDCRYSLLLAVSSGGDEIPNTLAFPSATEASIIVSEGQPTNEELAPLQALLKLYNNPAEREKLKLAYEGRLAEAKRIEAERAANPPEKKPLKLQYWRLDAAGIQGTNPKPATIR